MPRPWIEKVEDHPPLRPNTHYLVRVADVRKHRNPPGIGVKLEHLGADQAWRTHDLVLPVPVRPAGITTDFFAACSFRVAVDQEIQPRHAVGHVLQARFAHDPDTGDYLVIEFRPAKKEQGDAD